MMIYHYFTIGLILAAFALVVVFYFFGYPALHEADKGIGVRNSKNSPPYPYAQNKKG